MEELGWNDLFASGVAMSHQDIFSVARVIAVYRGVYKLKDVENEFQGKVKGKTMFNATSQEDYPAVGDWVTITKYDNAPATIHAVLPRRSLIKRRYGDKNRVSEKTEVQVIAANVDVAFIVVSVDRDYSINRIERYIAMIADTSIVPVVVINKADLISAEACDAKVLDMKKRLGDRDVIVTDTKRENGVDALKRYMQKGKTYCFLGSSGVGKSSLINTLLENNIIKTGDISTYSHRGTHTTTQREMYFLAQGGIVIDNPGIREVGVTDVNDGIEDAFDDMLQLAQKCKFVDCTHTHEPGCAILSACKNGAVDRERYDNYVQIKKELAYHVLNKKEKREKDRRFGKSVNKIKKELKNTRHKYYQ